MSKIIIIIPSEKANPDSRFIKHGLEWTVGWRFEKDRALAYKECNNESEKNTNICYANNPHEIKIKNQEFLVVWININKIKNGCTELDCIKEKVEQIIDVIKLSHPRPEIKIAYHQDMINYIPRTLLSISAGYSLAAGNMGQFNKITIKDQGDCFLNKDASFNDIYECFFLNLPKKIAIIKHRVLHLFLPLDIDIQGLIESGFDEHYLSEIVKAYQDPLTHRSDPFIEAVKLIYKSESDQGKSEESLEFIKEKALKDGDKDKENKITCLWKQVTDLIPKDLSPSAHELYNSLASCRCVDQLREKLKEGKTFHKWYLDLEKALDDFCKEVKG